MNRNIVPLISYKSLSTHIHTLWANNICYPYKLRIKSKQNSVKKISKKFTEGKGEI